MDHRTAKDRYNRLGSHVKADNPIPECLKQRGYSDIYLYLMGCDDPAFVCEKDGKKGLVDASGNYILPCEQDEIYETWGMQALIPFRRNGLYGLYQNGVCTDAAFQDLDLDEEREIKVKMQGKWGWVDKQGLFTQEESEAYFYADWVSTEEDALVSDGVRQFHDDVSNDAQDDEWTDAFVQIMADNGLADYNQLRRLYRRYKPESKGCNMDDPIVITSVDYNYVSMERDIIEYIFSTCDVSLRRRFQKQALLHKEDRWLDCLTYAVLDKDGGVFGTVSYWFDITLGIESIQEMLKSN